MDIRTNALKDLATVKKEFPKLAIPVFDKDAAIKALQEIKDDVAGSTTRDAGRFVSRISKDLEKLEPTDFKGFDKIYRRVGQHLRDQGVSQAQKASAGRIFANLSENIDKTLDQAAESLKEPALKDLYRQVNRNFRLSNKVATTVEKKASALAGEESLINVGPGDLARLGIFGPKVALPYIAAKSVGNALPVGASRVRRMSRNLFKDNTSEKAIRSKAATDLLDKLRNNAIKD